MPILTEADRARIEEGRTATLGDDLRKPEIYRVGRIKPDGTIETYPEGTTGEVYVRRLGDGVGEAIPALYDGQPIDANAFVEVDFYRRRLRILRYAPENAIRREGVPFRPQTPIDISQFNYGLLRPSSPPSMSAVITGAIRNLNGEIYQTGNTPTKDFTPDIPVADAVGVMIELDPTTGGLTYTLSTAFSPDLSLEAAFSFLPSSVSATRFLCGYVKLYAGQTTITQADTLPAQEIISKAGGGDPFAKAVYAPGLGHLVTDVGELVIIE